MKKLEFKKSDFDHYVYVKEVTEGTHGYLILYMDDMFVASKILVEIDKIKKLLSARFEMKDLGQAKRILGMDIGRDSDGGILTLSQSIYIERCFILSI